MISNFTSHHILNNLTWSKVSLIIFRIENHLKSCCQTLPHIHQLDIPLPWNSYIEEKIQTWDFALWQAWLAGSGAQKLMANNVGLYVKLVERGQSITTTHTVQIEKGNWYKGSNYTSQVPRAARKKSFPPEIPPEIWCYIYNFWGDNWLYF